MVQDARLLHRQDAGRKHDVTDSHSFGLLIGGEKIMFVLTVVFESLSGVNGFSGLHYTE